MTKYYYNGILLPEIPSDILLQYPYCWIRDNGTTGNYDLVVAFDPWYFTSDTMNKSVAGTYPYYSIPKTSYLEYDEWVYNADSDLNFGIDTNRVVLWSNHDVPNGSATSTTIYFYKSESISEDSVKPKEFNYTIFTDFYPYSGSIEYQIDNATINYVIPVKKYSTYTVTMTEVGNRLRSVFTTVNPSTIKSSITSGVIDIVMNPEFSVGYTFSYMPKSDGWMIIYVSNAGETPEITIKTNGVGGDGAPLYDCLCIIKSENEYYSFENDILISVPVINLTSEIFKSYGFDFNKIEDWSFLISLSNPEIIYWQDSQDKLPPIYAEIEAIPKPQIISSEKINLDNPSIKGIEYVTVNCEGDFYMAVSFDNKQTWKMHNGVSWVTIDDDNKFTGMSKQTVEAITLEQWNELYTNASSFYIRVVLLNASQSVKEIYVKFKNT